MQRQPITVLHVGSGIGRMQSIAAQRFRSSPRDYRPRAGGAGVFHYAATGTDRSHIREERSSGYAPRRTKARAKEGEVSFFSKIKALMGLDFTDQARREIEADEDQAARRAAERFARGSVGIQKGAFQTRGDLDRAMKRVRLPPTLPREQDEKNN